MLLYAIFRVLFVLRNVRRGKILDVAWERNVAWWRSIVCSPLSDVKYREDRQAPLYLRNNMTHTTRYASPRRGLAPLRSMNGNKSNPVVFPPDEPVKKKWSFHGWTGRECRGQSGATRIRALMHPNGSHVRCVRIFVIAPVKSDRHIRTSPRWTEQRRWP